MDNKTFLSYAGFDTTNFDELTFEIITEQIKNYLSPLSKKIIKLNKFSKKINFVKIAMEMSDVTVFQQKVDENGFWQILKVKRKGKGTYSQEGFVNDEVRKSVRNGKIIPLC